MSKRRGRSSSGRVLSFLAVLAAPAAAHSTETAGDPAVILGQVKQATGAEAWDAVRTQHVQARIETGGMVGTAESWDDLLTGRFVDRVALGPLTETQGFDGRVVWSQDSSKQARREEGGEEREAAANEAYRRSLSYWYPQRLPGAVEYAGLEEEGGRRFHVLRATPQGGRPFTLWIDAATFLIDRTVEKMAIETRTTYLSDYRTVGGLKLPFGVRSTNGETRYDHVVKIESITFNPPLEETLFAMPAPPAADYRFTGGRGATTVPFELLNNHIYVQVKLNGQGPFRLLCDTGGVNIVTPALAARLGLKTEGALQGRGVGEKSEDVGLTRVQQVELGELVLDDQVFMVFDLDTLAGVEGLAMHGLIGYELFKRFVVRVDYEQERLTFSAPAAFTYSGDGLVVPFTFNGHLPQVEGTLDGLPGKFDIDTGSRASLSLLVPFVEQHQLRQRYSPRVEGVTGWGVGGPARSQVTRAKELRLGGVHIAAPLTLLSLQKAGGFTDPYVAGNVGGGILKRFNVTFDYGRQQLVFEPNARHAGPDVFDRSGMWLNSAGAAFEVIDVIPGGPAERAGLRVGDRIVAVDGAPAERVGLPALRERFKTDQAGSIVRLKVLTGTQPREVALALADLV